MWEEVELPKEVLNDIDRDMNYTERKNVFHASELAYNCPLRMYFDRTNMREVDSRGLWAMYRGRVFDKHINQLFDESEIRVAHRVPGTNYIIRGRIDGINYTDNVIYEVKTVEFMDFMKQPRDAHQNQALFYLACYDPLATLKIIYVSMGGNKTYKFTGGKSELNSIMQEYDRKAKILGNSLKKKEEPEPLSAKECDFCTWRQKSMCPIKKPKQKRKNKKFVKK